MTHHGLRDSDACQRRAPCKGLGMPPQDAVLFLASLSLSLVTGIRNGSLLSVASVIDRRRA